MKIEIPTKEKLDTINQTAYDIFCSAYNINQQNIYRLAYDKLTKNNLLTDNVHRELVEIIIFVDTNYILDSVN